MIFIFKQSNRKNWEAIAKNCEKEVTLFEKAGKDFQIEISRFNQRRSSRQLKAFFMLIEVLRAWMNDKGNHFSKSEVASWVKIRAGFCDDIEGILTPRTLASSGDCTKEEMERMLLSIEQFGAENSIENCYIESREKEEFLKHFNDK